MKIGDKVALKKEYRFDGVWSGVGRIVARYKDRGCKIFLVRWADGGFTSRHIEDALRKVY